MCKVKQILVGFILTMLAVSAFAQTICNAPKGSKGPEVAGCWELVVLNTLWDASNPLMKGLDNRPDDGKQTEQAGLERQQRAQFLGPQLWHAQHAGTVRQAKARSFLVMMWNTNPAITDHQVTGFKMNAEKTASNRTVPENVTGKIVAPKGMGEPDRVYRIYADGMTASIQFPWPLVMDTTKIIVCAEDNEGVYPNKVTLNQGHLINSESLKWLREKGSMRGLMPFVSKS